MNHVQLKKKKMNHVQLLTRVHSHPGQHSISKRSNLGYWRQSE